MKKLKKALLSKDDKRLFWVGIAFIAMFFLTAYLLFNSAFLGKLDSLVNGFFVSIQNPFLAHLMVVFDFITGEIIFSGIVIVVASMFFYRQSKVEAIFLAISIFAGGIAVKFFKDYFEVLRPIAIPEDILSDFSFPSGHTTLAFLFLTILGFLLYKELKSPLHRKLIVWGFPIIAIFTAINRLYLGVHWLSDVIAGIFLGLGVALISLYIYRRK